MTNREQPPQACLEFPPMRNLRETESVRLRSKLVLAGIAVFALAEHRIQAQSHDVHSPTPLGQGVNKGNVDNKAGSNYYYFHAGPGHVNLKFAFKAMGVFGNPLRQTISFDLYTEDGKLISHNPVTSLDKLEQVSNGGDFDSYHKVTLRIMAPSTALRLGGYYEIEVTGAVGFGSLFATGSDTKPVDTSWHKSGPLFVQETHDELRITLATDILFDFDKATFRPSAAAALRQAAALIREKGHGTVRIDAYTDSKGDDAHNLRLSEERAAVVKAWLIANEKSNTAQLETRGLGADNPLAPNTKPDGTDNPEGRRRNRRVEMIVSK